MLKKSAAYNACKIDIETKTDRQTDKNINIVCFDAMPRLQVEVVGDNSRTEI